MPGKKKRYTIRTQFSNEKTTDDIIRAYAKDQDIDLSAAYRAVLKAGLRYLELTEQQK